MEDKIFHTGVLLFVTAIAMRSCSNNDADQTDIWWKHTVVATFVAGGSMVFASLLAKIWN